MSDQDNLLRRAEQVLPGGILGSHRSGPGLEFVVKEGRGAYLYDMAGQRYLDYLLGSGPMLLGHAHPAVVAAVERQMARGTSYFLLNEPAIQLAEEIVKAVPCAEQVRYTSSGSEATFFALRVARAFRKRDKIMKFEGGFHGTHDYALMSVVPRSPKAFPAPMMDSAGVPHAIEAEVLIAPYNDLATAEALIAAHHDELAAVLIEPYQRTIVPAPGFLAGTARRDAPVRRAADLRRDRDRIPLRLRRRPGILRRGAGPGGLRQGGGRRLSARVHRRAEGDHAPLRRGPRGHRGLRLAGRNLQRQRHRVRGRPRDPGRAAEARHVRTALQDRHAAARGAGRRRAQARPRPRRSAASRRYSTSSSPTARSSTIARRSPPTATGSSASTRSWCAARSSRP